MQMQVQTSVCGFPFEHFYTLSKLSQKMNKVNQLEKVMATKIAIFTKNYIDFYKKSH